VTECTVSVIWSKADEANAAALRPQEFDSIEAAREWLRKTTEGSVDIEFQSGETITPEPVVVVTGEWRDISSAPKFGAVVALYHEHWPVIHKGKWDWVEGPGEDGTGGWCAWLLEAEDGGVMGDGQLWPDEDSMPTHWAPLPEATPPNLAYYPGRGKRRPHGAPAV